MARPFERRRDHSYPYFKIASWDDMNFTWRDGKRSFPTAEAARLSVAAKGRYRISEVTELGRVDLEPPFEI